MVARVKEFQFDYYWANMPVHIVILERIVSKIALLVCYWGEFHFLVKRRHINYYV